MKDRLPTTILVCPEAGLTEFTEETGRVGSLRLDAERLARCAELTNQRGKPVLVDLDHASLDGSSTEAAGWLSNFSYVQGVGIYADCAWTDLGADKVQGRSYIYVSPAWQREDLMVVSEDEPLLLDPGPLDTLALTNTPALDQQPIGAVGFSATASGGTKGSLRPLAFSKVDLGAPADAPATLVELVSQLASQVNALREEQVRLTRQLSEQQAAFSAQLCGLASETVAAISDTRLLAGAAPLVDDWNGTVDALQDPDRRAATIEALTLACSQSALRTSRTPIRYSGCKVKLPVRGKAAQPTGATGAGTPVDFSSKGKEPSKGKVDFSRPNAAEQYLRVHGLAGR